MGRLDESQVQLTGLYPSSTLVSGDARGGDASVISSIRNNLVATAAPTGSASFASGYYFGSIWIWGTRIWDCVGDAVWQERGSGEGSFYHRWTNIQASYTGSGTGRDTVALPNNEQFDPNTRFTGYSNSGVTIYQPGVYHLSFHLQGHCASYQGEIWGRICPPGYTLESIYRQSQTRYYYGVDDNFTMHGELFLVKTDASSETFVIQTRRNYGATVINVNTATLTARYKGAA